VNIDTAQIKRLREITSLGVMECKRALEEASGDFEKAQALLAERAKAKAAKKADREMTCGVVDAYIHGNGRIGVLVEVRCETDFLAASKEFRAFVKDVALQIASQAPRYISRSDVPREEIDEIAAEAERLARAQGKPERAIEAIKDGKVKKHISQVCLLEQPFIKDPGLTVGDLVRGLIAKSGENVHIASFCRRQIGG